MKERGKMLFDSWSTEDEIKVLPENGEYIKTNMGLLKVLNNTDPLKLGRLLTKLGWAYPA